MSFVDGNSPGTWSHLGLGGKQNAFMGPALASPDNSGGTKDSPADASNYYGFNRARMAGRKVAIGKLSRNKSGRAARVRRKRRR